MTDKLTLPEARKMVAEILLSAPGTCFSDPNRCVYFYDDESPACVLGHVLHRLGIGLNDLVPDLAGGPVIANSCRFCLLHMTWQEKITTKAAQWLGRVQEEQDIGYSWGEVYVHFFPKGGKDEAIV